MGNTRDNTINEWERKNNGTINKKNISKQRNNGYPYILRQ